MPIFEWLSGAALVGVGLFFLLFLATAFTPSYPLKGYFANSGLLVLGIGFLLGAVGLFGTFMTASKGATYGGMSLVSLFFGIKLSYTAIHNFRQDARLRRMLDDK